MTKEKRNKDYKIALRKIRKITRGEVYGGIFICHHLPSNCDQYEELQLFRENPRKMEGMYGWVNDQLSRDRDACYKDFKYKAKVRITILQLCIAMTDK